MENDNGMFWGALMVLIVLGWMGITISAYFASPGGFVACTFVEFSALFVMKSHAMAEWGANYAS